MATAIDAQMPWQRAYNNVTYNAQRANSNNRQQIRQAATNSPAAPIVGKFNNNSGGDTIRSEESRVFVSSAGQPSTRRRDFNKPIEPFVIESNNNNMVTNESTSAEYDVAAAKKSVRFDLRPKDVYDNALHLVTRQTSDTTYGKEQAALSSTVARESNGNDDSSRSMDNARLLDELRSSSSSSSSSKQASKTTAKWINFIDSGKALLLKAQNNRDKVYPCFMLSLTITMLIIVFANKTNSGTVIFLLILIFIVMVIVTLLLFRN